MSSLKRSGRLKPCSAKQAAANRAKSKAYQDDDADSEPWCAACGRVGPLEHSHILTQKNHPQHRANPLNWLRLCRACHSCWEDNKARFKLLYPEAFAEKMRRMQLIDRQGYAFFLMKNPTLFPS